ncbi:thioesterase-like superfamily-domain-containing protein [Microdochium bolleyi]|uniref:Thioesterase-like superfamily-domain-containing protein n=1 Tax=Microdochium bolleyi TaxID=196109 RepID=A0A136JDN7_9PEZI|nr:thioesterase-like superfamily-domain-containing protein [Microdochium bolleyi]
MDFVELGPATASGGSIVSASIKRYMSTRPAWVTGGDLPFQREDYGPGRPVPFTGTATYGGHVYAQSGLVAAKCFADSQAAAADKASQKQYGIHTIHGYFAEAGSADRPFIYEVQVIAANAGFHNLLVTVRQPVNPSMNSANGFFPIGDSKLRLGPVCFTALVSFRPVGLSQVKLQEEPPQQRFRDILSTRPPSAWDPSPLSNVESVNAQLPTREPGTFPGLHMHKVDLSAFNNGKPLHDRRELLLYRLLAPLPESAGPSMHIMCHAFEADRNSLFMLGNHAGFGWDFGRAASLSYSFIVHVNPQDAVMQYGENEWWIQEVSFPRVEAGRGVVMSKLWSPAGVHIATEYQDGIIRRQWREGEREGKL